jgi:TolB-like protein/DNA-binding winged helix-turn-helix (wHTH) protein/Flp pilus assembly protein TadD
MPSVVRLYRFGPYELDRNKLRKFGVRLKLERKPLRLLVALLHRAGEVVTRGELHESLWGQGVYVDFDKGLNVAVTKVRVALNDPSEKSKYIETVAGEGYRFVAKVERVFASDLGSASERNADIEQVLQPPALADDRFQPNGVPQASTSLHNESNWFQKRRAAGVAAVLAGFVLLAVASVKLAYRLRAPAQGPATEIMLVVLPFENLSGDPSLEYLSDGVTEELSEQLGNLNPQRLGVIGRTSAMTYKHSFRTIRQIGKELGVGYVLEGSVRQEGKKVRVTAQLVRVSDQAHVWAADYDRDIRGLVQLEDDVAHQITSQVGVSVALGAPKKLNHHNPDPEAHQAYLLGRYYWNKRTPAGYRAGEQYFRRASEMDPQYAAAYAGLAESLSATPEAKAAALKAIDLDPTSGEARTALGFVELFREVDVPAAESSLQAAIQLDPNYATAHHWYAGVLEATGRLPEATAELRKAIALDPLSLIIRSALAHVLSLSGQQDAALAEIKSVFDMDPHFPKAHEVLGGIYERKGMYKEAVHEFQLSLEDSGEKEELGAIGYVYAISGNKQAAWDVLAHLQELNHQSGAFAIDIALVNIGLSRKEDAIAWLQKASLKPDDGWLSLRADPNFDPLRSDPRFQALLRHMKLLS